ncbi:MAG: hypothetical protein HYY02_03310 [Chloroflexi bacterium]|nr:hypothetical protein [Chloroflexota bacterium]
MATRVVAPPAAAEAARQGPAAPAPAGHGPRLVYTVLRGEGSAIWMTPAPGLRDALRQAQDSARRLAQVDHREGYGLKAALSPDGGTLAYLVLPPQGLDPASDAALWVLDLERGGGRRLLEGLDLRSAPAWSQDSRRLAVRQTRSTGQGETQAFISVELATDETRTLVEDTQYLGIFAVGWAEAGSAFYFATVDSGGTDLRRVDAATGAVSLLLHASDGVAQDFRLAPDGEGLLYAEFLPGAAAPYRVLAAALPDGRRRVLAESATPLLGALWRPGGVGATLSAGRALRQAQDSAGGRLQGVLTTILEGAGGPRLGLGQTPTSGFLAPLAWSPDGSYLAVRQLTGEGPERIAEERLAVVAGATGALSAIAASGYAELAGWLDSAGQHSATKGKYAAHGELVEPERRSPFDKAQGERTHSSLSGLP